MAVLNLDMYSYQLAMNTQVSVILPERRGVPHVSRDGKPFPVLYLLHGHGQDHTSWLRLSRIEYYLANTDLIVVMPNTSRGAYVDGQGTHNYGTFLTEELPTAMKNWFQISPKREDTYIAGLSMGGYGALRAAFAYPEKYAAAAGLSSAIRLDKMELGPDSASKGLALPTLGEVDRNFRCIFGPDEEFENTDYSLKVLAKRLQESDGPKPRIIQLCGDDDPLLYQNDDFAAFMKAECPGLDHTYQTSPGMHNFDFWDREILTALKFFGLM